MGVARDTARHLFDLARQDLSQAISRRCASVGQRPDTSMAIYPEANRHSGILPMRASFPSARTKAARSSMRGYAG